MACAINKYLCLIIVFHLRVTIFLVFPSVNVLVFPFPNLFSTNVKPILVADIRYDGKHYNLKEVDSRGGYYWLQTGDCNGDLIECFDLYVWFKLFFLSFVF